MTRIKTCGITTLADAELAVELGAWAVGLVLWPDSPRACAPDAAEEIGAALHRRCEVAGVFVNATLDEVALAADRYGLTILQLHGDEGPAYCREAARRTGAKVMKAVRVKDAATVRGLGAFRTDYHLLDAYVPGRRGGTGESFAWELLANRRGSVPLVLSGGLSPDNVGAAIATAWPFAVDSASGTEAAPGRKDPAKLRAFARAVAAADEPEAVGA
ncbi:MAG: phosphoribosylanthranilate isomerase [Solirubrobacterales bacterium]|nr:phosphoribosylanthranilate isomerase [Solirubrobacterales bacterium]